MPAAPEVSIIIVSYNVSALLDTCLRTIKQYTTGTSYEVIVVDSASSDDSVTMVREKYPWVTLIANEKNVGFSKGNNLGLEVAKGKDILYLNPDIELIEDAITPMVAELHSRQEIGIVGCKLLNTDRTLQGTIGHFTSLQSLVNEFVRGVKKEEVTVPHPTESAMVEVLLGACLLVRGTLARELGGFDERYFMYNEETDLCLSAREQGQATLYYPAVAMIHHGSQSSNKTPEIRQRSLHIARVSMLIFLKKHYGYSTVLAGKWLLGLSLLVRFPVLALRSLGKSREDATLKLRYYGYTLWWMLTGKRVGY